MTAVANHRRLDRAVVRLVKGDITQLDVDAFVYYAQPSLALGSGIGTAIAVRGGPTIQKELGALGPIPTGEAVVSGAGDLPATYIIHAVGPRFQEPDIEAKLRATVLNALKRADEKQVRRIAFPAMGAGYYGVSPDLSARVMLEAIAHHLRGETTISDVVICVLDTRQQEAFQAALSRVGAEGAAL